MSGAVWVVDDDPAIRYVLEEFLGAEGFAVEVFDSAAGVREALGSRAPGLLMADVRLAAEDGIELMQRVHENLPDLPVIVMTAYSDLESAVSAFREGAFEFLAKPFDLEEVGRLVRKALSAPLRPEPDEPAGAGLIGDSPAFRDIIRTIGRLSGSDIAVLITGETGTGKEVVARALHANSPRRKGPFVAINTAAIPEDLLESELFGHERGAFTGAVERRPGRFEQARGGTLFLDEIGDMPLNLQSRLLRVLAEGEYYRVGGRDLIESDARVVTATHRNLEQQVAGGRFRADLYHRLKVITLELPPLRRRAEDVPALARHFLRDAAEEFELPPKTPESALLTRLSELPWPGNVRELRHLCQSLAVLAPATTISVDDLPREYRQAADSRDQGGDWTDALARHARCALETGDQELLHRLRHVLDQTVAAQALARSGGNRSEAARALGISRNTLARILSDSGDEES